MKKFYLFFLICSPLFSATWNIDADGNWNVNGNWTAPATFPNAIDAVADLDAIITSDRTITLGETITIGTLNIDNANNYRINSNQLILDVTAGTTSINVTNANGNGAHRISSPVQLNDNLVLTQGSTSAFEFDGLITGLGGFTKNGTGRVNVDVQNNTYSGTTTINEGIYDYQERGAIPNGGTVVLGDGAGTARLIINRSMSTASAFDITINSDGRLEQGGNDIVRVSRVQGSGQMIMNTANVQLFEILGTGGDSSFSGVISGGSPSSSFDPNGAGRLRKSGASRLTLSGTNTYSNRTFVGDGSQIRVQSNAALGAAPPDTDAFAQSGGAYELDNGAGLTLNKRFRINGTGESSQGAIRNVAGSNEISALVQVGWDGGSVTASDASIGVDGATTLTLSDTVIGISNLTKVGAGELIYSGTGANTHSGTTTVDAGTLRLNKTGVMALGGDLVVNAGGVARLIQAEQIIDSADVTISGGEFDMNGNAETISELLFTSGTLSQGGATLTAEKVTARDVTISGPIALSGALTPAIVFDPANNGTATLSDISLGGSSRQFDIGEGSATIDMLVGGVISGAGGFEKIGDGRLDLSGSSANTFTGPVTLTRGTLGLDKTGVNALTGDTTINPNAAIVLEQSNQIADSVNLTIDGGSFAQQGNIESINSLTFNSGTMTQSGAPLFLVSTGTALTMRDTTIPGVVTVTGAAGGNVVFDAINNGTATIGNILMNLVSRTVTVGNGTNADDMVFSASSGVGFNKMGNGTLRLDGTNTHSGGAVTVSAGSMKVNGTLTTDGVTVNPTGTLLGSGTVTSPVSCDGTIAAGGSIGTLTVSGDVMFNSGSVYEVELNPSVNDLLLVTGGGDVTISPGSTLSILPDLGAYPMTFTYTIISTPTGSVTGTFDTVTSTLPLFLETVIYQPNAVLLSQAIEAFSVAVTSGNAAKVASCLDAANPAPGSDLEFVIDTLQQSPTIAALTDALNQMQPSMLKGYALAQESNAIGVRLATSRRIDTVARNMCFDDPNSQNHPWGVWFNIEGDYYRQSKKGADPRFRSDSGSAMLGFDYKLSQNALVGGSFAYSYSDVLWQELRGKGTIQNGYATVFGSWKSGHFYLDGALLGAYNHYDENRDLRFLGIRRTASSNFNGGQVLGHFGLGGIFVRDSYEMRPFGSVDYTYLYQGSFQESGADSLNLWVDDSHYDLLRSEIGGKVSKCFVYHQNHLYLDAKLSYVREDRFFGSTYDTKLKSADCSFTVDGLKPTRNIVAPSVGFFASRNDEAFQFDLHYDGEFASQYRNHSLNMTFVHNF